jgi:hypothetical protein
MCDLDGVVVEMDGLKLLFSVKFCSSMGAAPHKTTRELVGENLCKFSKVGGAPDCSWFAFIAIVQPHQQSLVMVPRAPNAE